MDYFTYKDNELFAEDISVSSIIKQYQTPCYIYSKKTITRHFNAFNNAFEDYPHLICYAVKANSNLNILNLLANLNSGFDVVSQGELQRVQKACGKLSQTVFSGVGKTSQELLFALQNNIYCINVESLPELERLQSIASQHDLIAPVSLRVNPNVDAKTHPYIATGLKENKFGIELERARNIYKNYKNYPNINFNGIGCHIGSQLTELAPFIDSLTIMLELIDSLAHDGLKFKHLNLGGGLGVKYIDETPPHPEQLASTIREMMGKRDLQIILEPGRAIMANSGILVTSVEYLKHNEHKNFAVINAGMNDLLRPALYNAQHQIIQVELSNTNQTIKKEYDIVGPVCETADCFGKNIALELSEGDLIAIRSTGAYGMSMGSNYNSRMSPVEVLVDNDQVHLIKRREEFNDLIKNEVLNYET